MPANNKQIDSRHSDAQSPERDFVCENDAQVKDQSGKSKQDRKLLLLILLMLLLISQVMVLLASSGFNDSPESTVISEKQLAPGNINEVESDLKNVITNLNVINREPDLKEDQVEVEKVVVKPAPVPVAPVVVNNNRDSIKPEQKVTEKRKTTLVAKVPATIVSTAQTKEVSVGDDRVTEVKPAYIKQNTKGGSLEDNTEQWTCVHDTSTGLMWEVKSESDAMRKSSNLYSWYNPAGKTLQGKANGGRCEGDADCDTNAYIKAMNERNYCGHDDWQLPTREEMQTLVKMENGNEMVTINKRYFPQTKPSWYWTSTENSKREGFAWYVLFRNGFALNDLKERPKHIRLVRRTPGNTISDSRVY